VSSNPSEYDDPDGVADDIHQKLLDFKEKPASIELDVNDLFN
jgi:hypothetical protein